MFRRHRGDDFDRALVLGLIAALVLLVAWWLGRW